jgi:hypothetical protein
MTNPLFTSVAGLALLLTAGCSSMSETAEDFGRSDYNPLNWQLRPEAPPDRPTAAPSTEIAGIKTVRDVPGARLWVVEPGTSARETMNRWAAEAGYQVHWNSAVDRKNQFGVTVYGTFEDAVMDVFNKGYRGRPSLTPSFMHGNKIVIISQDRTLAR